ncbi:YEATS domain-containing protein 4, partial [Lecanoromycetidae sp. Uapishka_2]
MPAAAVYGSIAKPIDPANRPAGINPEHTHQWSVYVRGVDGEDISYWLKKVQFKLHETYANSSRMIENAPFEVTESGWGEFEVQLKLYFVPESNEKAQTLWHALKLHPYDGDIEGQKERRDTIVSQNYEEVIFNEPVEPFYEILTSGLPPTGRGSKGAKGSKQSTIKQKGERTAEIPYAPSPANPYSQKREGDELDRLKEAMKVVEAMAKEERVKLRRKEEEMDGLKKEVEQR